MFNFKIAFSINLFAALALSFCSSPSYAQTSQSSENTQDAPLLRPAIDTSKPVESVKTPLIKDSDSTATNTPIGRDKTPAPPTLDELLVQVRFTSTQTPVSREPDLVGIKVQVQNNSQTPLLFDGDKAVLYSAGQKIPAIASVEKKITMKQAFIKETNAAVVAGVTIGAYPTIRDMKNQKGPILKRYGTDEQRRENLSERFGKRILWPGDLTEGVVFVHEGEKIAGASVEMPVGTFPEMKLIGPIKSVQAGMQINP
ncbi:MAG: hypothetical protein KIT34_08430 [Cyanobacteria bacterium TGS_CYA1]|nr:hypothetical protein [Cyanobacteria bacterium TGS_CYA1]